MQYWTTSALKNALYRFISYSYLRLNDFRKIYLKSYYNCICIKKKCFLEQKIMNVHSGNWRKSTYWVKKKTNLLDFEYIISNSGNGVVDWGSKDIIWVDILAKSSCFTLDIDTISFSQMIGGKGFFNVFSKRLERLDTIWEEYLFLILLWKIFLKHETIRIFTNLTLW